MATYRRQKCNVIWNGEPSFEFRVTNGVRQGGVLSAILFAVYIDELLFELRKSKLGCHIDGVFFGAFIFADDVFLLSGNIAGLQVLVDICSRFAAKKNLKFGTDKNIEKSKTKCIAFHKNPKEISNLRKVLLDGNPLPWVHSVKHLGTTLQSDNSMKLDIAMKRGKFIGKVNSLLQEFHYLDPPLLMKLINSCATSFYSSSTWDILSAECEKLYRSWNVTVRNVLKLDRCTHRSLIEPLSGVIHVKTALLSRYLTFIRSLESCDKLSIRYLTRVNSSDCHSQMGKILSYICETCEVERGRFDTVTQMQVKRMHTYSSVAENDEWTIQIGKELLQARNWKINEIKIPGFRSEEIDTMLNYICTS